MGGEEGGEEGGSRAGGAGGAARGPSAPETGTAGPRGRLTVPAGLGEAAGPAGLGEAAWCERKAGGGCMCDNQIRSLPDPFYLAF